MVMQSGRGIDPRRTPFLQAQKQRGDAAELLRGDKTTDTPLKLFLPDIEHANDLAITLARCERYHMPYHYDLYLNMAKWQSSVNGHQAKLFSQTAMGFGVPEFYGGEKNAKGRHGKDDEPNR